MTRRHFLETVGATAAALTAGAAEPPARTVLAVAHRGDHTNAHENSLEAIQAAIRAGSDYVELDVRSSRDGVPVLMHDRSVARTTDGVGAVAELDFADLRELRLRDPRRPWLKGQRIPRFEEALEAVRGKIGLYLDFKAGQRSVIAALLKKHGVIEATAVYDGLSAVAAWRTAAAGLRLMVSPDPEHLRGDAVVDLRQRYPVEILDGGWRGYTAAAVAAAHRQGFQVWVDAQGDDEGPEAWRAAVALGVDGIQTDRPGDLLAWLKVAGKA